MRWKEIEMFRPKCLLAAVGVLFALGASLSSQAVAATAGWMVNGTKLTGTAALATTLAVDQEFTIAAGQVEVKCSGETLIYVKPKINAATNRVEIEAAEFTECEGNKTCPLATSTNGRIRTLPVVADVTLDGASADKGSFLPTNTSKQFATIKFEGAECALVGVESVVGRQAFLAPAGQVESSSRLLTATTEVPGELRIASTAATFKGSALARLANNLPFSFL